MYVNMVDYKTNTMINNEKELQLDIYMPFSLHA